MFFLRTWSAALFLLHAIPSKQQVMPAQWPTCQEQGRVFRHNGVFGIFLDLTEVGAKEGCWQENCLKTDKFVCPSPGDCAVACAAVEVCKFWTYEPSIRKCFLRSSDAGREENQDFVSGSRSCRPDPGQPKGDPGRPTQVPVPFARTALWAAELPAIRGCDNGIGAPGCENPYAVMAVWRYATNNLRLAINGASEQDRRQPWFAEAVPYVQQIASDVANFYRQPTPESFQVVVSNAKIVFSALKDWMQTASPTLLQVFSSSTTNGAVESLLREAATKQVAGGARVRLADGHEMPLLGFGTWYLVGQAAYDSTLQALHAGYRHIDTAQVYMNEEAVGQAIRDSGIARNAIFLATKCSEPEEYPHIAQRFQAQLSALGTDYLDLYMLHTPASRTQVEAAWRALEELHDRGKIRSLGVSNFGVTDIESLLSFARVKPVYVQNKFSVYSPGEQQIGSTSILGYVRSKGLQMVGYSVINSWPLMLPPMEDPHVKSIAARIGRTEAQVLHRWALQQGVAVLPRSSNAGRIQENAKLFEFELSSLDMRLLTGLVVLSETNLGSAAAPSWIEDVYGLGSLQW